MRATRPFVVVTVMLFGLLAVGGCTSAPAPSPSVSAPPSATASPTPQPSKPTAIPRLPALGDLVITPSGLGSLRIGKPVTDSDMVIYYPDFCHEMYPEYYPLGDPNSGRWLANYPGTESFYDLFVIDVDAETQQVIAISIASRDLKTDKGIHIGSTYDELAAAYALQDGRVGPVSSNHFITEGGNTLIFEVIRNYGDDPENNTIGTIRLGSLDGNEEWNYWATDAGIGSC